MTGGRLLLVLVIVVVVRPGYMLTLGSYLADRRQAD